MKHDRLRCTLQWLIVLAVFTFGIWSYHFIAASDLPEWIKFCLLNANR